MYDDITQCTKYPDRPIESQFIPNYESGWAGKQGKSTIFKPISAVYAISYRLLSQSCLIGKVGNCNDPETSHFRGTLLLYIHEDQVVEINPIGCNAAGNEYLLGVEGIHSTAVEGSGQYLSPSPSNEVQLNV